MRRSLVLLVLPALAAAALLVAPTGAARGDTGPPVVTGAVQVTDNPNLVRAHMLPLMARNPTNGELVVAEVDGRGTRECVVHISVDGGRSWFAGGGFMVKPFTDCSIGAEYGPAVMPFFDRNGVLNVAFTANDPAKLTDSSRPVSTTDVREDIPRNAYLARSTDGGRTFTSTLVAAGKEGNTQTAYIDAPSGAVDPNNPNLIYVGWGQGDWSNEKDPIRTMVAASTDAGKTWGSAVEINNGSGADYPWITVDRRGGVHATYWSRGVGTEPADPTQARPYGRKQPSPIMHAWSTDQGRTWQRAVLDVGSQRIYRPPVIVADPNSDAVYAAWQGVPDPMNFQLNRDAKDRTDVYFKASTDLGKTWSERVTVNDDPQSGVNHEAPNIAIAPNGRIDMAWYDYRYSTRGGTGTGIQDVFSASSTDGGKTFGPNRRITDRSIDRSIGVYAGAIMSFINVGIASTDDVVYYAWQDSRNGRPNTQAEDIYTASLMLDGPQPVGASTTSSDDRGVAMLLTGLALGAGLAMVVVWIVGRSRSGGGGGSQSKPSAAAVS
ncbi:MAG: sialidase family protein [Acidimicrobiales bacterium]